MDTDFETTQSRYAEYLERTPALLASSLQAISSEDGAAFQALIRSKRRIFCTGAGSSIPAAAHGADRLRRLGQPAQFLPTGTVLGLDSLSADDVVILSSQGVNRADALLVIDKTCRSNAPLVLLTANRDAALQAKADLAYYFDPAEEKLFCRPAGVSTNYAVMDKLCRADHANITDERLIQAWQVGRASRLALPAAKRYLVLSSDEMMPVAWNVALALREGSGLHSELFDIETYGHGTYVGDLRARSSPEDFAYILVHGGSTSHSGRAAERILPFIRGIEAPYCRIEAEYADTASAALHILARVAQYVYERNQTGMYNMNRPTGKEENRYYHELDSYRA